MVSFHKRGLVLLASIILLVFASIAVLSVTTFIVQRFSGNRAQQRSLQSVYLAQAGINQAIYSYRSTGANAYFTPGTTIISGDATSSFVIGGTSSLGFDSDLLMVDTNSGNWSITTYDTIAIRSERTGNGTTNAANGTFTVNKPATVANNDYLVCIIGKINGTMNNVNTPLGWVLGNQNFTTTQNDVYGGIFYKKITNAAGEPASYTFTSIGRGETFGYWIGSLSGIDQTTPEDVAFSTVSGGQWTYRQNNNAPPLPSVTTVTPRAFALGAWSLNADGVTTQPGGSWANRADDVGTLLNVVSQTFATAGTATGTANLSAVANNQETQTGTFVFRPAALQSQLNYGRIKSAINTATRAIKLTKMIVSWPANGQTLQSIYIGNTLRWSGNANPGDTSTLNGSGVNIDATGLTTNNLRFSGIMGQPTTTVTFIMSDSIGNAGQTVNLWPNTSNFRFIVKASGKKTGSSLYRTIQAEYNANTGKVVDYREINTQMQ